MKTMTIKARKNKEDYINDILEEIDSDIISVSKVYSSSDWEDVAQETRIHMWQVINNNYIKKMSASEIANNIEDILLNCRNLLIFYANLSRKSVIREKMRYYDNNLCLDDNKHSLHYDFSYHKIDFEIDYKKYCKLLNHKELELFEYICMTNPSKINYDDLSRQLGFSSKNGIKYTLLKVAQKIAKFDEKNKK